VTTSLVVVVSVIDVLSKILVDVYTVVDGMVVVCACSTVRVEVYGIVLMKVLVMFSVRVIG